MAQLRVVAMVLIHSMDSDEELQVQIHEELDACVVNTTDSRTGIKMTPKVPPEFDGQSIGLSMKI